MIVESLQTIKNAEKEAAERSENAKAEAAEIAENAKAEAERLISERIGNARDQAEKARKDAERDAREECQVIDEQWNNDIERIRKEARENTGKAREFILRTLLG
jgi:vacuolar-type H+-ATPase subunit H